MPTTDLYELPFPTDDLPADVPVDIEALAQALDRMAGMFFPGDLKISAAQNPPEGWLVCDGRAVDRALYPALFAAIGVAYGVGDGALTFNLPNFIDRFPMGATSVGRGVAGGAAAVALTGAEMPHHAHGGTTAAADRGLDHTHWVPAGAAFMNLWTAGGEIHQGGFNFAVAGQSAGMDRSIDHLHAIAGEGGNQPHNNLPPFVGVNVWIKT
jgi:microcystin-dependent protein